MTVIVLKDGVLVADSRQSAVADETETMCKYCNNKFKGTYTDNSKKLRRNGLFNGKELIGWGGAGNVKVTNTIARLMRDGNDPFVVMNAAVQAGMRSTVSETFNRIIAVAKDGTITIAIFDKTGWSIESTHQVKDNPTLAIGSGAKVALFAAEIFNLTALDCVVAAIASDSSCGGKVNILDTQSEATLIIEHDCEGAAVEYTKKTIGYFYNTLSETKVPASSTE